MKFFLYIFLILPLCSSAKEKLYLIAGHGSDISVYSKIIFPDSVDTVHLHWIKPVKNETMHDYSFRLAQKIDTNEKFSIMGLSLGGMIACEMTTFLNPDKVIIISSAAGRSELPVRYRMMRKFEIYRIFSGEFYKSMTRIAQLTFEPDRRNAGEIFDKMIENKDPDFIKRAIHMIANWEGEYENNTKIIHIHGTKDHTIPIRNTFSDVEIRKGSHMMLLTDPVKLSAVINSVLEN